MTITRAERRTRLTNYIEQGFERGLYFGLLADLDALNRALELLRGLFPERGQEKEFDQEPVILEIETFLTEQENT